MRFNSECIWDRFYHIAGGVALVLIGIVLTVFGLTVVPPLGLVFAVPVFAFAIYLLGAPPSKACSIH